jgi:hypothetical protein
MIAGWKMVVVPGITLIGRLLSMSIDAEERGGGRQEQEEDRRG